MTSLGRIKRWWRQGAPLSRAEWFVLIRPCSSRSPNTWFQARTKGFVSEEKARTWAREFVSYAHDTFDTQYDFKVRREPYVHPDDRTR